MLPVFETNNQRGGSPPPVSYLNNNENEWDSLGVFVIVNDIVVSQQ
jgi:hypothetical protein